MGKTIQSILCLEEPIFLLAKAQLFRGRINPFFREGESRIGDEKGAHKSHDGGGGEDKQEFREGFRPVFGLNRAAAQAIEHIGGALNSELS